MRQYLPSVLISVAVIAFLLAWELSPRPAKAVVAVLGPDTTLQKTVSETDAYLLGQSTIPRGYILYSKDPNFAERLKRSGAILVLNAAYSGGCVTTPQNTISPNV